MKNEKSPDPWKSALGIIWPILVILLVVLIVLVALDDWVDPVATGIINRALRKEWDDEN